MSRRMSKVKTTDPFVEFSNGTTEYSHSSFDKASKEPED